MHQTQRGMRCPGADSGKTIDGLVTDPIRPCFCMRNYHRARNELLELNKTPSCTTFPSGLELVGPELRWAWDPSAWHRTRSMLCPCCGASRIHTCACRDLDKRIPYERGLSPAPSLDAVAGDGMSLKPSWAFGRFGQQANKQANDAAGAKAPPPGTWACEQHGHGSSTTTQMHGRKVYPLAALMHVQVLALVVQLLGRFAAAWWMMVR